MIRLLLRSSNLLAVIHCFLLIQVYAQNQTSSARNPFRRGAWASAGAGVGFGVTSRADEASVGLLGYIRVGGTLSDRIRLGGEWIHWHGVSDGLEAWRGHLAMCAQYYPIAGTGLFGKAGFGPAVASAPLEVLPGILERKESIGLGTAIGVGYDMRIDRRWSVISNLEWVRMIRFSGAIPGRSLIVVSLGVSRMNNWRR